MAQPFAIRRPTAYLVRIDDGSRMSVADQSQVPRVGALPRDAAASAPLDVLAAGLEAGASGSSRLRPLLALLPYVSRYRGKVVLATLALIVAALTTLVVPVAIRRIVDFGFTAAGIAMINSYFGVMIGVVAVLALASAARYYLVTTIGERVVADVRRDVFAHTTTLSPAFFDLPRSG